LLPGATRLRSFHLPFPQLVYPYTLVGLSRFRLFILPLHHPPGMRHDVQEIFRTTPHHKQGIMFSAMLAKDIRVTCKKFMFVVLRGVGSSPLRPTPSHHPAAGGDHQCPLTAPSPPSSVSSDDSRDCILVVAHQRCPRSLSSSTFQSSTRFRP
jgi:hypothetical protein